MSLRRPDYRPFGDDFSCRWRRTSRSISAIQVVIGIVFVLVIGTIIMSAVKGNDAAQESAADWAKGVPDATRTACASRDTDNDGYVSCTVFREAGEPIFLECGTGILGNDGCRAQKMMLRAPY